MLVVGGGEEMGGGRLRYCILTGLSLCSRIRCAFRIMSCSNAFRELSGGGGLTSGAGLLPGISLLAISTMPSRNDACCGLSLRLYDGPDWGLYSTGSIVTVPLGEYGLPLCSLGGGYGDMAGEKNNSSSLSPRKVGRLTSLIVSG
ncbi:ORF04L [Marbled eel polyomavirus]|uniref:ORF04L n=1 Tax=Marbled eel polyomavirus TaxID=1662286 RepID=UPI0007C1C429|nr:ORF04L [Marbled eel polyomavirus]ANC70200.1 ORF04L [Marbled eel polyomavirus]